MTVQPDYCVLNYWSKNKKITIFYSPFHTKYGRDFSFKKTCLYRVIFLYSKYMYIQQ
jgi:hypothetical protein